MLVAFLSIARVGGFTKPVSCDSEQMTNRLFGRLVEPRAVKPHLPIPLFLAQKPV